jgi:hypothetical protein
MPLEYLAVTVDLLLVRPLVQTRERYQRMFGLFMVKETLVTRAVTGAVAVLTVKAHQPKAVLVGSSTLMVTAMSNTVVAASRNTRLKTLLVSVRAVTPGLVGQPVPTLVATGS